MNIIYLFSYLGSIILKASLRSQSKIMSAAIEMMNHDPAVRVKIVAQMDNNVQTCLWYVWTWN